MKRILAVLFFVLSVVPLHAIGFGYHVFEVRTIPEFSEGIFPSSILYQFNFPMPDFLPGSKTEFAFRLDNGLVYRSLRQNPNTAKYEYIGEYTVQYDEFNLYFAQGFHHTEFTSDDLVTLTASIDGRWENAFERLSWMNGPGELQGVFREFANGVNTNRWPDAAWNGNPELRGARSSATIFFSFGLEIDYMRNVITRKDGVYFSSFVHYAPGVVQFFGKSSDFILWRNELDFAWTIFSVRQKNVERDTTWISLVLEDKARYQFVTGSMIPGFTQGGEIWGTEALNSEHVFSNRVMLTLYGPQINSYDCYPRASVFFDFGVSFGRLNGTDENVYEVYGSYGFRAEFVIFNIANAFYEIGYVFDPIKDEKEEVEMRYGVSLGI